jgi:two-component sensor histidine kinase/ABC-type branched-subunit amino acid transport system ATPase component
MGDFILQIKDLKSFNSKGEKIINLDIDLKAAEVHALVGDNDFTTRTFIDAISGQCKNAKGKVILNEKEFDIHQIDELNGLAFLFQRSKLVECLSVAENLALDNFPRRKIFRFVNWRKVNKNAKNLLKKLNFKVDYKLRVSKLSSEEKRLVNIAKNFYSNPDCIVMYNPTEDLSSESVQNLYQVIDNYKKNGKSVIYVTKQWEEALKIADRISVIYEGEIKKTFTSDEAKRNPQEIISILGGFNQRSSFDNIDYESKEVLDATFKAAEFLTSENELNDILLLLSKQVTKFMNADGCIIHLIDDGTNTIIDTLEFKLKEEMQAKLKEEVVLNISQKQEIYYSNHNEKDFISKFEINNKVKTIICVPALIRSQVTGIIQIFYENLYANSEEETRYLSAFARHAAIAIEDTRLMGRSALLQESHHRIKNSLQSIINLIALQKQVGEASDDKRLNDVLNNIISRVRSIAFVHDLLDKDKIGRSIVNIKDIVEKIAKFFSEMNVDIKIHLELEDIFIPYNKATSIALIINELLTNCVKHAFDDKESGLIIVRCNKNEEFVLLSVEDNGTGMPIDFDANKRDSSGVSIVSSIIGFEFKGNIEFESKQNGTKVEIRLPNKKVFIAYKKKK